MHMRVWRKIPSKLLCQSNLVFNHPVCSSTLAAPTVREPASLRSSRPRTKHSAKHSTTGEQH